MLSTFLLVHVSTHEWVVSLEQWLKPPAWKVGDREFDPRSGIQFSKKKVFTFAHSQRSNIVCVCGGGGCAP